ncbi:MAG: hypothetical protein JO023_27095 [Chloroflexi bacterium]|nr:hypothetical protein [Chloroflexota bacterium]
MELPRYFLPRPDLQLNARTIADFERLFAATVERGDGAVIEYTLAAPRWQFLCYLCDQREVLLHGSGQPDIVEFEPRQSNDVAEFGNRRAVYAASDGIWPVYFAIVDRDGGVTSLVNSCARVIEPDGGRGEPHYFFSINADALSRRPWRQGTVYLLPRQPFERQAPLRYRGLELEAAQWASPASVRPLARLPVEPGDFPFLGQMRGHDPRLVRQRAARDPDGFPWLDD